MSLINGGLAIDLVKELGDRTQESPSEQKGQEFKPLDGVLSKQQLAAYFGTCESTLTDFPP